MHSRRLLDLLVMGLSALSVAEATFNNRRIDVRDVKAIQQRQQTPTKDDVAAAATDSESKTPTATPTPSPSPSPSPSLSASPKQSSEPPKPSPSTTSTPPPVVSTSPTPQAPSTTKKPPAPSPSSEGQAPPKETTTEAPPPPPSSREIKTITHVSTVTNKDGTQSTLTSESLTTATPGLADGGNNGGGGGGGSSGMTPQTRNIVIGVVVGVGGAIILIGLGFVAWRIWGRKRSQDEQDGLMDYTGPNDGKSEVGGSMSGRTPFQSTLESYHAPTQVNQAANF